MCDGWLWPIHYWLHSSPLNAFHIALNRAGGVCTHEQALLWLGVILLYSSAVMAFSYAVIDRTLLGRRGTLCAMGAYVPYVVVTRIAGVVETGLKVLKAACCTIYRGSGEYVD